MDYLNRDFIIFIQEILTHDKTKPFCQMPIYKGDFNVEYPLISEYNLPIWDKLFCKTQS